MKNSSAFIVTVSIVGCAMMSGCATPDQLSRANYTQIQQNTSTQADVEALIGKPTSQLSDMWVYQRPDDHLTVLIDFDSGGRVSRKQWVDGVQGAWDDTNQKPTP